MNRDARCAVILSALVISFCGSAACGARNPSAAGGAVGFADLDNLAERTLRELSAEVFVVAFCDGASQVACGDSKGNLTLWHVDSGHRRQSVVAHPGGCYGLVFVPARKELISAGNGTALRVWDLATLKRTHEREARVHRAVAHIALSPSGNELAYAGSGSDNTIHYVDALTGDEKSRFTVPRSPRCLTFSPDGKALAAACNDDVARIWNVAENAETNQAFAETRELHALAFGDKEHVLITGGTFLDVWNGNSATRTFRSAAFPDAVQAICVLPGKKITIAVGGQNPKQPGFLVAMDYISGNIVRKGYIHTGGANCVAASPDGRWLATGSRDGTVKLWRVEKLLPDRTK